MLSRDVDAHGTGSHSQQVVARLKSRFLAQQNNTSVVFTRRSITIFVLIICLYIAVRLWRLDAYGLWYDEVFSVKMARLGWRELIFYVIHDLVHPPLFYLLLKAWIGVVGDSLFWLKLNPVLTAIAVIVPFFLLCQELRLSAIEVNTALLLMTLNNYLIYYAQELRMYSLLLFFTFTSLWLFVSVVNDSRKDTTRILFLLFFVNLLLVHTHYFGWLVVGTQFLYVLLWRRQQLLSFLTIIAALAALFAPWAYRVSLAAAEKHGFGDSIGWIKRPHLSDLISFYACVNGTFAVRGTTVLSLIVFGFPLLLWSWNMLKDKDKARITAFRMLVLFSLIPITTAYAASQVFPQSIWGQRHLIITVAPYLILVAVGANQIPNRLGRVIVTSVIICWASSSSIYEITRNDRWFNWDSLAQTIVKAEPTQPEGTSVFAFEEYVAGPLRFLLEPVSKQRFGVVVIKRLADVKEAHFWVSFRDSKWRLDKSPQSILRDNGCWVERETKVSNRDETVTLFHADCDK
jgi:mannosyltransferase